MTLRPSQITDLPALLSLYRYVAAVDGGLARTAAEITYDYIGDFITKTRTRGLSLVAEENGERIVGEIHAYPAGPRVFAHVLGDLTIAVAPDRQGAGLGRALFTDFLRRVTDHRPDVLRIELFARESNARALAFYQSLGFHIEGRLERRIRTPASTLEADLIMAWLRPETH